MDGHQKSEVRRFKERLAAIAAILSVLVACSLYSLQLPSGATISLFALAGTTISVCVSIGFFWRLGDMSDRLDTFIMLATEEQRRRAV